MPTRLVGRDMQGLSSTTGMSAWLLYQTSWVQVQDGLDRNTMSVRYVALFTKVCTYKVLSQDLSIWILRIIYLVHEF